MPDPIRWGVLSTAAIAANSTIPAITASGNGVVHAVASRDADKAAAFAEQHGIANAYGSYEALLADPEVDAIYNPLPVSLHADWSIRCAEAGKACLCEKPLTTSKAEAIRMRDAFAERDVLLSEVGMYRYHPVTRRVHELVSSGAIGELNAMRATFFVSIDDENDIRWRAETAGGAVRDVGCYCLGIMRLLAGEEPSVVQAMADWRRSVDATLVGTLQFPGGALGYFGCGLRSQFDCSYEVFGTGGRLRVDRGGMVVWPGEDFRIQKWIGEEESAETIPAADHYQLMVEDFAAALQEGRAPLHQVDDAIANMDAIDRCLAAAGP